MSRPAPDRYRLASLALVLAFPLLLIGYAVASSYGWDFARFLLDARQRAEAVFAFFQAFSEPILRFLRNLGSGAVWVAYPVTTGVLVWRAKLVLSPLGRASASFAGLLTAGSLFWLSGAMSDRALVFAGAAAALAAAGVVMTRREADFPTRGLVAFAGVVLLTILGLVV